MPADWSTLRRTQPPEATRALLETSLIHAEALARLDFLVASRSSLGLLIGPGGCGKSAVFGEYFQRAQRQGFVAVSCNLAGADEAAFFSEVSLGLSLPVTSSTGQAWRQIADRLCELQLESLHAVLLLDDLDRAGPAALAVAERLLTMQTAPLTIVASACLDTAARLGERILEHAALRIDLVAWNEEETSDYLARRASGSAKRLGIEKSAARRLFELSGGAPRRVNQLALLAEVASVGQGLTTIDEDTVNAVYEELAAAR